MLHECYSSSHFSFTKIRWRNVKDDDESQFRYLEQEVYTNSSRATKYTVTQLQPFTVYSFHIAAINHVGRSRPSKNSYPAITLRERKLMIFNSVFHGKTFIEGKFKRIMIFIIMIYQISRTLREATRYSSAQHVKYIIVHKLATTRTKYHSRRV